MTHKRTKIERLDSVSTPIAQIRAIGADCSISKTEKQKRKRWRNRGLTSLQEIQCSVSAAEAAEADHTEGRTAEGTPAEGIPAEDILEEDTPAAGKRPWRILPADNLKHRWTPKSTEKGTRSKLRNTEKTEIPPTLGRRNADGRLLLVVITHTWPLSNKRSPPSDPADDCCWSEETIGLIYMESWFLLI